MRRLITIFFLSSIVLISGWSQTVPAELTEAIRRGNANKMSLFFHQSLEMTILEKDYMASKNQATRIMENFFKNNPPTSFTISFEGTKEKSKYAIGSLKTNEANFRVNMFFLNRQDDRLIYYLSIEKESQYEIRP